MRKYLIFNKVCPALAMIIIVFALILASIPSP
jgi:hypothetical protein